VCGREVTWTFLRAQVEEVVLTIHSFVSYSFHLYFYLITFFIHFSSLHSLSLCLWSFRSLFLPLPLFTFISVIFVSFIRYSLLLSLLLSLVILFHRVLVSFTRSFLPLSLTFLLLLICSFLPSFSCFLPAYRPSCYPDPTHYRMQYELTHISAHKRNVFKSIYVPPVRSETFCALPQTLCDWISFCILGPWCFYL
jgi:hypothetical protein